MYRYLGINYRKIYTCIMHTKIIIVEWYGIEIERCFMKVTIKTSDSRI